MGTPATGLNVGAGGTLKTNEGADQVGVAGLRGLCTFPQCPHLPKLGAHHGKRQALARGLAQPDDEDYAFARVASVLPGDVGKIAETAPRPVTLPSVPLNTLATSSNVTTRRMQALFKTNMTLRVSSRHIATRRTACPKRVDDAVRTLAGR